jgi:hypothetical protein
LATPWPNWPGAAGPSSRPALEEWLHRRVATFTAAHSGGALDDLRRIWRWPPEEATYAYPSREWFNQNPTARLAEYR